MPWKETSPVIEKLSFVLALEEGQESMSELCRRFGISRETGYRLLRRWKLEKEQFLLVQSRAPKSHPNEIPAAVQERIVKAREERPTWGPVKLKAWLEAGTGEKLPAASTIGQLLKTRGLTVPRKRVRRSTPSTQPFADCAAPNDTWCVDFKGWFRTGNGSRCDPFTITDAHSRFLIRCHIVDNMRSASTRAVMEAAFREYGLPRTIRSDNGAPFSSTAIAGLSRLSIWWIKLGIVPERIKPGKPQQNGRHERMHLTLHQECVTPPEHTLRAQQRRFDRFREQYNKERPHAALGNLTPASLYQASARPFPSRLPELVFPDGVELRRVKLHGEINWQGGRIFISEALAHELVGIERLDQRYALVHFGPLQLSFIDLKERALVAGQKAAKLYKEYYGGH